MNKKHIVSMIAGSLCALLLASCGAAAGSSVPEAGSTASAAAAESRAAEPVAESRAAEPEAQTEDEEIIETVLGEFELLAKIPRPSHHEKEVSDFLVTWAKERGFSPVQDDVYNVMFDVPATEGYEDLPLCILQGHMDMVAAVEDGKDFDPLTDPITVIRNEEDNTLTADGTSLGADDGAGVSLIMAAAEGKMEHGPLRMLITVDEEDGMTGAFNLDASWLKDAACLINIDNEASDQVLVSTASGDTVTVAKEIARKAPAGDTALTIKLAGLTGGHSGVHIDKGRMNGLIGLAGALKALENEGISFELADFKGGTANNAIPTGAACTIVISREDKAAVEERLAGYLAGEKKNYAGIEDDMTLTVTEADTLPQVVGEEEKTNLIRYMTEIIDGAYTWSADMEGLVESSSNLGLFSLEGDRLTGVSNVRSSVGEKRTEIIEALLALAESCGYQAESIKVADPWPYNPSSFLTELAKEVYLKQNGEEIIVAAVHAGLECGTFAVLNPDLLMISIGPDITDPHTVNETLYLNSVPKVYKLLEGILTQIEK